MGHSFTRMLPNLEKGENLLFATCTKPQEGCRYVADSSDVLTTNFSKLSDRWGKA